MSISWKIRAINGAYPQSVRIVRREGFALCSLACAHLKIHAIIVMVAPMGLMDNRVIVVPMAVSESTLGSLKFVLKEGARLFLGAPRQKLDALQAEFRGQRNVQCAELDLLSSEQIAAFIAKANTRFRRFDCLLLADEIWQSDDGADKFEDALGSGTRILLQCLDASLRYVGDDLHIITVSPERYRQATTLVASMFIRTKQISPHITIRMTAISNTGTAVLPDGPAPMTSLLAGASRRHETNSRQRASGDHRGSPTVEATI